MTDDPASRAFATPPWWDDDGRFTEEVGAAVKAARAVPGEYLDAAKAAFAWRTIDVELAQLVADSASGLAEAGGFRGEDDAEPQFRTLRFATADLTVDVELGPDALRGQVVPERSGAIHVREESGGLRSYEVDALGWFEIRPVPRGPFRLLIRTEDGVSVSTDWLPPRG